MFIHRKNSPPKCIDRRRLRFWIKTNYRKILLPDGKHANMVPHIQMRIRAGKLAVIVLIYLSQLCPR